MLFLFAYRELRLLLLHLCCLAGLFPVRWNKCRDRVKCFSYLCILLPVITVLLRGLINIQGRVISAYLEQVLGCKVHLSAADWQSFLITAPFMTEGVR